MDIENLSKDQEQQSKTKISKDKAQVVKVRQKKGRIILRNLVFDIREKHLKKLLRKFGAIIDIQIPKNLKTNKAKGFAFVEFEHKNMGLKAIKELNETKYKGRIITLDLSVDKRQFVLKKNKQNTNQQLKEHEVKIQEENELNEEEEEKEQEKEDEEGENEESVDQNKQKPKGQNNIIEEDEESFIPLTGKQQENKNITKNEEDQSIIKDEKDEENGEEENQNTGKKQKHTKTKEKEDLSQTLFVRNISFETTEQEFKGFCKGLGDIYYARLVLRKYNLEGHKGTGFVKFKDINVVKKILNYCQNQREGLPQQDFLDLELRGRQLDMIPSLQRNSQRLKSKEVLAEEDKSSKKRFVRTLKNAKTINHLIQLDKNKKRNIYLMKYGMYKATEVCYMEMDDKQKQKRELHEYEIIQKLKNSNRIVSKTRLMLKNLPKKHLSEEQIKEIINQLLESKKYKDKKRVKQIKLLKDLEKSEKQLKNISKGICFIELDSHDTAVKLITALKKDPSVLGRKNKLPIFQFAIDDVRKLQRRERKLQMQKQQKAERLKPITEEKRIQIQNQNQQSRIIIENIIKNKDQSRIKEAKLLLKQIKSRGLKQRLKKKAKKVFTNKWITYPIKSKKKKIGTVEKENTKLKKDFQLVKGLKSILKQSKQQQIVKQKTLSAKQIQNNRQRAIEKKMVKQAKRKRRKKRKALEHDDFDKLAEKYKKKINKQDMHVY